MPAGRRFEILTKRTRNDPGRNRRGSNEELVVAEIGQVGTQFDTFSHQMIGSSMYNCVTLDAAASRTGFNRLGVEQVGALMTRGVLLDIAALKGVPTLAETYEITPQDLQAALAAQKLTLQPGDAVLIHTGWGTLWGKDNARYQRVSPGIGTAAAEWLARQDPMLVGADNTAVEISPNPDRDLAGPVHQIMLVVNGIHLLENLRLDELAARRPTNSRSSWSRSRSRAAPDRPSRRSPCADQAGRVGPTRPTRPCCFLVQDPFEGVRGPCYSESFVT